MPVPLTDNARMAELFEEFWGPTEPVEVGPRADGPSAPEDVAPVPLADDERMAELFERFWSSDEPVASDTVVDGPSERRLLHRR